MERNLLEGILGRLSAAQQERVRVAFVSLEEGLLTSSELVDLISNVVLAGNARGYALGAAAVRSLVEEQVGQVELTPVTTGGNHADEDRVRTALATILASNKDTLMQLQRLADNEPKAAAAAGSADVLTGSRRVKGWTRSMDSQACELCRYWWREGRVWQPGHPMPRHTGCTCTQTPVTTVTENYQTEKQAADRRTERRRSA